MLCYFLTTNAEEESTQYNKRPRFVFKGRRQVSSADCPLQCSLPPPTSPKHDGDLGRSLSSTHRDPRLLFGSPHTSHLHSLDSKVLFTNSLLFFNSLCIQTDTCHFTQSSCLFLSPFPVLLN